MEKNNKKIQKNLEKKIMIKVESENKKIIKNRIKKK